VTISFFVEVSIAPPALPPCSGVLVRLIGKYVTVYVTLTLIQQSNSSQLLVTSWMNRNIQSHFTAFMTLFIEAWRGRFIKSKNTFTHKHFITALSVRWRHQHAVEHWNKSNTVWGMTLTCQVKRNRCTRHSVSKNIILRIPTIKYWKSVLVRLAWQVC